jgi:CO/xanthine dehydrogenase Mo-binding subunit
MSFKDAVTFVREDKGVHILGRGYYDTPTEFPVYREGKGNIAPAYTFGAGVAEIKVDKESGIIIIDKITQAQDVGKAINPIHCEGQIEGSIAGAIGQLLFEEFYMDKGIILNPNLLYYKIPTSLEMPNNIEPILIETMDEEGPFGAKGMSESPEVPPIGAVANAIYDALGIRIKKLPITPERILRALEEERK